MEKTAGMHHCSISQNNDSLTHDSRIPECSRMFRSNKPLPVNRN